jgi:hypothetical protein
MQKFSPPLTPPSAAMELHSFYSPPPLVTEIFLYPISVLSYYLYSNSMQQGYPFLKQMRMRLWQHIYVA